MLYKLPPRLRMFIDTMLAFLVGVLSIAGLLAMFGQPASPPHWYHVLAFLLGAIIHAAVMPVPFRIRATDRSGAQLERLEQGSGS